MTDGATAETERVGVVVLGAPLGAPAVLSELLARCGFVAAGAHRQRDQPGQPGDPDLCRVNQWVWSALGGSRTLAPSPARQAAARSWAVPSLRAELGRLLRCAGGRPVVLEDPRIGPLLPLWSQLLAPGFEPVLVVQDPHEIARCLNLREGIAHADALACWAAGTSALLARLAGAEVMIVRETRLHREPAVAVELVEALRDRLPAERAAWIEPRSASVIGAEPAWDHSTAEPALDGLSGGSLELWQWLETLPEGRHRLAPPAGLLGEPGGPPRRTGRSTRPVDAGDRQGQPPMPVVVGAPRSGTTMLRLMLGSHPELTIPPETRFIPKAWAVWERTHDPTEVLAALTSHRQWPFFEIDIDELSARIDDLAVTNLPNILRAFYLLCAERRGTPRWGEKSPVYALHLPLVGSILPEAHFIHIIRDGRDVALSVLGLWFGPDTIEEAARWWVDYVATARAHATSVRHYTEVRYEELVARPRAELVRLCRFVALPFVESMLTAHAGFSSHGPEVEMLRRTYVSAEGGSLATESQLESLVGRLASPPDQRRAGAWRSAMSGEDRSRFEAIAGNLLEELGYPLA